MENHFNFYFHKITLKGTLKSTRTHRFWETLGNQCPHKYTINVFENYSDLADIGTNNGVNVIFIPLAKPYFTHMEPTEPNWLQICYRLNDISERNVLVLDYTNETQLPGTFGAKESWKKDIDIQFERFYLDYLAVLTDNHNIGLPVAATFFNMSAATTVVYDAYHLRGLSAHCAETVLSFEGKTAPVKFLLPNRVARKHRLDIITEMHHRNLLDKTDWSMMFPDPLVAGVTKDFNDSHEYFKLFGHSEKLMNNYADWSNQALSTRATSMMLPFDDNYLAYVCIDTYGTTEDRATKYYPDQSSTIIDISEKVFKGFAQGLPTFYFSTFGAVNWLRSKDFWLPGNHIDAVSDVERRANLLNDMANFGDTITQEMMDGILHNRNLVLDKKFLYNQSSELIDFFYIKFYC